MPTWTSPTPSPWPRSPRSPSCKSRITIRVDNAILAAFKARAEMTGGNYQTLINEALRQVAQGQTLADVVRQAIREELRAG